MNRHEFVDQSRTAGTTERIDFGIADEKRRQIGCLVMRYEIETREFQPDPANRYKGWTNSSLPFGRIFCAYVTATRNGNNYGAMQREKWFGSEADREAWIAKRVASSRARYTKLFST